MGIVSRQTLAVEVEFFGFSLQERDEAAVPVLFPEGWDPGASSGFLTSQQGRLDVESAGHTHTARLEVEVWDSEPPADVEGEWEADEQAEVDSPSGVLDVCAVTGGLAGESVVLAGAGVWRVRLLVSGRAAVAEEATHGVPDGVERYLARFWPTR